MSKFHCVLSRNELERLLLEDVPHGDLTVDSLAIGRRRGRLTFHARDAMVLCAIEEAAQLFELAGCTVQLHAGSGQAVDPGTLLLSASGSADGLFRAWKVAQSLVESVSGVSTAARRIVEKAGQAAVACTRKHLPGNKATMVKAVRAGGATMHRLGLSESVMVTAEHRTFLEPQELQDYLSTLCHALPEKKCVVEVDTLEAALELVPRGCDVIQLEKLLPAEVARVVAARSEVPKGRRPVIAAAGGVNAGNAADYAAAGADVLVTSAPYFAPPRDVQVRFERLLP